MDIHYFSWIRNRTGTALETVSPPTTVTSPNALIAWLSARDAKYAAIFSHRNAIHISVNGQLVEDWENHPLSDTDEISFFSPLAGG